MSNQVAGATNVRARKQPVTTRGYLPAAERKSHLLDVGVTIVRSKGWEHLSIADLARRAGVSRQLVHQYFGDLQSLALELAEKFEDEVYETAARSIERHPDDFAAAMRETLEQFLIGLRDERLVYVDLVAGHWYQPRLQPTLKRVRSRKRRRLVALWARYYETANGLTAADAEGLSSFQYDGLRGLIAQVDAGKLAAAEAIDLFVDILTAAIERLGTKTGRKPATRSKT
jgi:AcrR family transcriptional regulator